MRKLFIFGTIFIFSGFAAFTTACSNSVTSKTVEQSSGLNFDGKHSAGGNESVAIDSHPGFRVDYKSEPGTIQAGVPTTLVLTVKDNRGTTVKDLQIVHEKPMHLLIVSKDLAEFYHVHPEQQADGSYRVQHNFPNGGEYRLYADFTPQAAAQVVERIDVKVAGAERAEIPLVPDQKLEKTVEGLKVVMNSDGEIKAGQELMLNFQAFDAASGKPAADLQNYLGELAHFVIVSEDMKDFVHAHPMSKSDHEKMSGGEHSAEKAADKKAAEHNADNHSHSETKETANRPSASQVSAHTAFPRTGLYKVWAQFQRGGKVITVPFIVRAAEGKTKAAAKNDFVPAGAVKVTVSSKGYEPSEIKIEKNKPVKLAFYRSDANNCGGEVVFSKLNINRKLPVGEVVLVEFTPQNSGEIAFSCGMDMMKGKVIAN